MDTPHEPTNAPTPEPVTLDVQDVTLSAAAPSPSAEDAPNGQKHQ